MGGGTTGWLLAPIGAAAVIALVCSPVAHADATTDERVAALRARLAHAPADPSAHLALAAELARSDRAREALEELDVLEALHPRAPGAAAIRARALAELGHLEEAVVTLDEALRRGDEPDLRWQRGRLLERLDRLAEAAVDYEAAVAGAPSLERHLVLGRALERLGALDRAARAYRDALSRFGGAAPVRVALARVEEARGRPREALVHVDALIAASRVAPRWLVRRAALLTALGRSREAAAALALAESHAERMVRRRRSALALLERGRVRLAQGRRAEAIRDLEQALRRAPRLTEARALLAEAR